MVTKLWTPALRPGHVRRDRPLTLLRAGTGRRLTLVCAPAGSGKTSAVAEWLAGDSGRAGGCWFTADRSDNDPTRFWTYVITAIREVLPGFGYVPLAALAATRDVETFVLPPLINQLAGLEERLALVIDDFQLIGNASIHAQVEQLLDRVPGSLQLVLVTRTDPPLPLSRWRGRGELMEVRAADLRFDPGEAADLFEGMELELDGDDVERLVERTEGWAAGLSLAGLSLAGREDRAEFVREFTGTNRHVLDYLGSEVLDGLDAERKEFLVWGSALGQLSGPLCDAALERQGSAALLAELERSNSFVVPLDASGDWYRLHHLFAEVLAARRRAEPDDLTNALHSRASHWYAGEGMTFEAIEHAVAACDATLAADLLMPVAIVYAASGQAQTVGRWVDRLGEARAAAEPRLCLSNGLAYLIHGSGLEYSRWVELAARRSYDGPLPGGPASIEAGVETLRGFVSSGRLSYHLASARRAEELSRGDESPWRDLATGVLGLALYWAGETDEATAWFERTADSAPPLLKVTVLGLLSLSALEAGDLAAAEALAAEGRQLGEQHHLEPNPPYGRVLLARGRVNRRRGELAAAASLLEQAVDVLARGPYPYDLAGALLALAEVRHAGGARRDADAALREARLLVQDLEEPGVLADLLEATERRLAGEPGEPAPQPVTDELSARELDVLKTLPSPLSEAEIGKELFISYHTVHSHIRAIYRKLGTTSRAQTVERARASGLLPGPLVSR